MLFNVSASKNNETKIYAISANTWSNCINYLENENFKINSISYIEIPQITIGDLSTSESFNLTLKNTVTNLQISYIIFDKYENVISWIGNQSNYNIVTFNKIDKIFVSI